VITIAALTLPRLIGSMVVVETLFAWPGMGMLMIQSVYNRDYPVVLASVFVMALVTTTVFIITDFIYALLDPRIRYE
jgi:ABC-type dipeptide/oligopeptide/nickel transport system permease component